MSRKNDVAQRSPYRILGEIPWGGRDERPVLGGTKITSDARSSILRECSKLMRAAEEAADLPSAARHVEPIDARDLEQGIRDMGGSYATNDRISRLDVMLYTCRVVDRLLAELGIRSTPRDGGYPTNTSKMRERVRDIAAEVHRTAAAGGVIV